MNKRLASLFLLLVLFGGAFAGVPLHFSESNCSMSAMVDMDCCTKGQHSQTKFTPDEQLLCALNCAQNGTTLPSSLVRVTPPSQTIQPTGPDVALPLLISLSISSRVTRQVHNSPGSPPIYLRNLTLLI